MELSAAADGGHCSQIANHHFSDPYIVEEHLFRRTVGIENERFCENLPLRSDKNRILGKKIIEDGTRIWLRASVG